MVSGNDINNFFTVYAPTFNGIASIVGACGGIIGICSTLFCKKAYDKISLSAKKIEEYKVEIKSVKDANIQMAKQIEDYKIEVKNIRDSNAQFAKIINNYGLSLKDTKDAATEVFEEKAKNKPDVYLGEEEPEKLTENMIWLTGSR